MPPVKIVTAGSSIDTSNASEILLGKYPFEKIDTQSDTSFQTVTITFNNDPPEPPIGLVPTTTTVYQFAHGYNYTPRVWAEFVTDIVPIGTHFNQAYFQDAGVIAAYDELGDFATMYVTADQTNVYIKVNKYQEEGLSGNNLTNSKFTISIFVFADEFS